MSFRANIIGYGKGKSSILEIGPLDKAVFNKTAFPVHYADHLNEVELKKKYRDDQAVNLEKIPTIDFDLSKTTFEEISTIQKFDLIFASHVVEHIADPIQWLNGLAGCVNNDGQIILIVPDKRFTFDFFQAATPLSEILNTHLERPKRPTVRMVKRYFENVTIMRPRFQWMLPRIFKLYAPKTFSLSADLIAKRAEKEYIDVHCHYWTPISFQLIFDYCSQTNMIPLQLVELVETERHDIEFFAVFQKKPHSTLSTTIGIEAIDLQIKKSDRTPAWGLVKSIGKVVKNRLRAFQRPSSATISR